MVAHLHDAGLEVILDVVYNHTAEGNELGPTLSFKGIDNASYYRLLPDQQRYYINDTGTGNTVNLSHPRVLQMVMDCLRYWARRCTSTASASTSPPSSAREPHGFDERQRLPRCLRQDPVLVAGQADRRALGSAARAATRSAASRRAGRSGTTISRHGARLTGRATTAQLPALAPRLHGSADLFNQRGRKPWAIGQLHHRA